MMKARKILFFCITLSAKCHFIESPLVLAIRVKWYIPVILFNISNKLYELLNSANAYSWRSTVTTDCCPIWNDWVLGFLSNFTHTMACSKFLNPKLLHCHESELSFIAILKWSVWNCVSTRYTEVQMLVFGNVATHCRVIFGTTCFLIN